MVTTFNLIPQGGGQGKVKMVALLAIAVFGIFFGVGLIQIKRNTIATTTGAKKEDMFVDSISFSSHLSPTISSSLREQTSNKVDMVKAEEDDDDDEEQEEEERVEELEKKEKMKQKKDITSFASSSSSSYSTIEWIKSKISKNGYYNNQDANDDADQNGEISFGGGSSSTAKKKEDPSSGMKGEDEDEEDINNNYDGKKFIDSNHNIIKKTNNLYGGMFGTTSWSLLTSWIQQQAQVLFKMTSTSSNIKVDVDTDSNGDNDKVVFNEYDNEKNEDGGGEEEEDDDGDDFDPDNQKGQNLRVSLSSLNGEISYSDKTHDRSTSKSSSNNMFSLLLSKLTKKTKKDDKPKSITAQEDGQGTDDDDADIISSSTNDIMNRNYNRGIQKNIPNTYDDLVEFNRLLQINNDGTSSPICKNISDTFKTTYVLIVQGNESLFTVTQGNLLAATFVTSYNDQRKDNTDTTTTICDPLFRSITKVDVSANISFTGVNQGQIIENPLPIRPVRERRQLRSPSYNNNVDNWNLFKSSHLEFKKIIENLKQKEEAEGGGGLVDTIMGHPHQEHRHQQRRQLNSTSSDQQLNSTSSGRLPYRSSTVLLLLDIFGSCRGCQGQTQAFDLFDDISVSSSSSPVVRHKRRRQQQQEEERYLQDDQQEINENDCICPDDSVVGDATDFETSFNSKVEDLRDSGEIEFVEQVEEVIPVLETKCPTKDQDFSTVFRVTDVVFSRSILFSLGVEGVQEVEFLLRDTYNGISQQLCDPIYRAITKNQLVSIEQEEQGSEKVRMEFVVEATCRGDNCIDVGCIFDDASSCGGDQRERYLKNNIHNSNSSILVPEEEIFENSLVGSSRLLKNDDDEERCFCRKGRSKRPPNPQEFQEAFQKGLNDITKNNKLSSCQECSFSFACQSGVCLAGRCAEADTQLLLNSCTCNNNEECESRFCQDTSSTNSENDVSGTCQGKLTSCRVCNNDEECLSGVCTGSRCAEAIDGKLKTGCECNSNLNCRSGRCLDDFINIGVPGKCSEKISNTCTEPCLSSTDCISGLCGSVVCMPVNGTLLPAGCRSTLRTECESAMLENYICIPESEVPSFEPSVKPASEAPGFPPSVKPTPGPTFQPSLAPSTGPSQGPSREPTLKPSVEPTFRPSHRPTLSPSLPPSNAPSTPPSAAPTSAPSTPPSASPTDSPSVPPSTRSPSFPPTLSPFEIIVLELGNAVTSSDLNDSDSISYRAVDWLATNIDSNTDISIKEQYAIIVLYFSTGGENWKWQGNWLSSSVPMCDWDFILECIPVADPPIPGGRETFASLDLNNNNLVGTIPSTIGLLTSLTDLRMHTNALTGPIPTELGQLINLSRVVLYTNALTGQIPKELGQLINVVYLGFRANALTGPIPTELGQLINLSSLIVAQNLLTDQIPMELGQLINLRGLYLDRNSLTGQIPTELGQLISLSQVMLHTNALTGPIPTELGQLINLSSLALYTNALTGQIPKELGQLINLGYLGFRANALTGPIPTELGQLINLSSLVFDTNALTGPIPTELGQLINLSRVIFYGNSFDEPQDISPIFCDPAGGNLSCQDVVSEIRSDLICDCDCCSV